MKVQSLDSLEQTTTGQELQELAVGTCWLCGGSKAASRAGTITLAWWLILTVRDTAGKLELRACVTVNRSMSCRPRRLERTDYTHEAHSASR